MGVHQVVSFRDPSGGTKQCGEDAVDTESKRPRGLVDRGKAVPNKISGLQWRSFIYTAFPHQCPGAGLIPFPSKSIPWKLHVFLSTLITQQLLP